MLIPTEPEHEAYRVIVFGSDGGEVLLSHSDAGLRFPGVTIPRCQRVAENVTIAMKRQWAEEIVCLFEPDLPFVRQDNSRYVAARHWKTSEESAAPLQWVTVNNLGPNSFAESTDYSALQTALGQCVSGNHAPASGPFVRFSWFQELYEWIGEVLSQRGLHLSGGFKQLNASATFSLLRFETSGAAVWFKAVGEPNRREFPIALTLAQLLPNYVPQVLAARPDWNGWLMCEACGKNLDETTQHLSWSTAATALAKLQIDSILVQRELVKCGTHDMSVNTLRDLVSPFMDVVAGLMREQSKTPPPVLRESELEILEEQLQDWLFVLTDLGIPDSLGNLDLNPSNLIVSRGRCTFLDWPEAYVGHPLFSLQYLLEHFHHIVGVNPGADAELTASYFAPWERIVSPKSLTDAMALMPALSVFAYAVGIDGWRQPEKQHNPRLAGYLRALTRRLHREVDQLSGRGVLCLG